MANANGWNKSLDRTKIWYANSHGVRLAIGIGRWIFDPWLPCQKDMRTLFDYAENTTDGLFF